MNSKKFIPKHREIYDIIDSRIRNNFYKHGERLPSMKELCREFSVSEITVKAVIANLQKNKMVRSVRRSGTFVIWKKTNEYYEKRNNPAISRSISLVHSLLSPLPLHEYMMTQFAERFMMHNPHVKISFMKLSVSEYEDPYINLIKNGNLPSCGEFFWHARYAAENALYPLETLEGFESLEKELRPGSFYHTLNSDNASHIHALYLYLDIPNFLILNTEHLKKIPSSMSWQQVHRIIANFSRAGHNDFHASALTVPYSYHGVKNYIELLGQDLFSKGIKIDSPESCYRIFETESAAVGLEHLRRMTESKSLRLQHSDASFALGNVGILPFACGLTLNFINSLNTNFSYHAYKMPSVGGNRYYHPFISGFNIGIFRNGISSENHLRAAWEWIQFLLHEQSQYLLTQDLKLPVCRSTVSYMEEKQLLLTTMINQLLEHGVPQPDFPGQRLFFTVIGKKINSLIRDKQSPEVCLSEIRKELSGMSRRVFSPEVSENWTC